MRTTRPFAVTMVWCLASVPLPLAAVAPNNDELQRSLTFNPIYLTDGIQLSDDPFVALRSAVYALSVAHRH